MPFPVVRIVEHQCAVLASWLQLKAEVGGSPRLRLLPFQISFRESLIMPLCIFVIAIRYQMCEQFEFQWYVIRPFFGAPPPRSLCSRSMEGLNDSTQLRTTNHGFITDQINCSSGSTLRICFPLFARSFSVTYG